MYNEGKGVPQDDKAAVQWIRLAAKQGDVKAQFSLGVMYNEGKGVPQNYVHAYMWLNIAASDGHKNAVEVQNNIEKEMTSSQIAKAQKLARECIHKAYKDC